MAPEGNLWEELGCRERSRTSLGGCKGEIWTVIKPSELSSDHLCPCRTSTASPFAVVTWKMTPYITRCCYFPVRCMKSSAQPDPMQQPLLHFLPLVVLKHVTHCCCSPKRPVLHLSCPWRLQNTGPGWREGLTSLLGRGQLPCKAAPSCFEATEPLEEQATSGAPLQKALPPPLARLLPPLAQRGRQHPVPHVGSAWQLRDGRAHPLERIFRR